MFVPPLDLSGLRKLLDQIQTDADFDAFCLDFFPAAHARFTAGMDRVQKTTLLLQFEPEPTRIVDKLRLRLTNLAPGASARTAPGPRRSMLFAGAAVVLLLAAGLLGYLLGGHSSHQVAAPLGMPRATAQPTSLTPDSFPPGLRPTVGRLAVEQKGDG